jgi:polysaccharide export outer membrane protein
LRNLQSKWLGIALPLAWFVGAGCGGTASRPTAEAIPDQLSDEPAIVDLTDPSNPPPAERFLNLEGGARVAPGDLLSLRALGFPELSGDYLVAQDGRINLSLVGSIQAAGKSVDELDRDLTNAFNTYYRNMDLAVNVSERADRNVYVLGEVANPGRYKFDTGERVLHALASAGGMTESARENSIILMRREPDGRDHAYRLDFSQIHTQLAPRDIYVQPGDVVFVPKSRFKTATDFADDFLDVLSRSATSALVIDDLSRRTRTLSVAR